jgi:hypothetical protein
MNHSIKIIVLLAVLGLAFASCNNSSQGGNPYYKISNGMKAYCLFQKQSTWIYQNDSTGTADSLSVADISSYIGFHSPDNTSGAYSFDVVDLLYDTTSPTGIVKGSINAGNPTSGSGDMTDLYWLFFKNGNFLLAFAPGYPIGVQQRLGIKTTGLYTNLEKISDFSLHGKDYKDVFHTEVRKIENPNPEDTVTYQFYFAPHYGLIKWTRKSHSQASSFSLVQSNLVQ